MFTALILIALASTCWIALAPLRHLLATGPHRPRTTADGHGPDRALRPHPDRPVAATFVDNCSITIEPHGVLVTNANALQVLLPAAGPAAVTRWTVHRDPGTDEPLALDLCTHERPLLRLPWKDWFRTSSPTIVTTALGVHTEEAPSDEPTAARPQLLGDPLPRRKLVGLAGTVLLVIGCAYTLLFLRAFPGALAAVVAAAAVLALTVVIGAQIAVEKLGRHRYRPVHPT